MHSVVNMQGLEQNQFMSCCKHPLKYETKASVKDEERGRIRKKQVAGSQQRIETSLRGKMQSLLGKKLSRTFRVQGQRDLGERELRARKKQGITCEITALHLSTARDLISHVIRPNYFCLNKLQKNRCDLYNNNFSSVLCQ